MYKVIELNNELKLVVDAKVGVEANRDVEAKREDNEPIIRLVGPSGYNKFRAVPVKSNMINSAKRMKVSLIVDSSGAKNKCTMNMSAKIVLASTKPTSSQELLCG